MKVLVPLRTGQNDRPPSPTAERAPVKALALIVANRPDAQHRWAAELRSIVAIDFYPEQGA